MAETEAAVAVKTESPEKSETEVAVKTETEVVLPLKTETEEVKADAPVKTETEVKAEAPVKTETEEKAEATVKQETEEKAEVPVKTETSVTNPEEAAPQEKPPTLVIPRKGKPKEEGTQELPSSVSDQPSPSSTPSAGALSSNASSVPRPGKPGTLFGLPEGVQVPPSVDASLLQGGGGKLLDTLKQLPVPLINDALTEFDDAVQVKGGQIRNRGGYLYGVIKRYLSVQERAGTQGAGGAPMGDSLTPVVQTRLNKLVSDGFCSQEEVNDKVKSKIRMLTEKDALFAIEELATVPDPSQIRNFSSYFMGILNRYMRGEKNPGSSNHNHRGERRGGYRDDRPRNDNHYQDDRYRGRNQERDFRNDGPRYGDDRHHDSYRRERSRDRYDDDRRSDYGRKDDRFMDPRQMPQRTPLSPQQQPYSGPYQPNSAPPPPPPRPGMPPVNQYAPRPAAQPPYQQQPQQQMYVPQNSQPPSNSLYQPPQQQPPPHQYAPQPAPSPYGAQPQNPSIRQGSFVPNYVPPPTNVMQQQQPPQQYAGMPVQTNMPQQQQQQFGGGQYIPPSSGRFPPQQQQQQFQQQPPPQMPPPQQSLPPTDIRGLAEKAAAALATSRALQGSSMPQMAPPPQSTLPPPHSFSYSTPNQHAYAPPPPHHQQPQPHHQQQFPRRGHTTATMNELPVTVQYAVKNLEATGYVDGTLDGGMLGMIKDLPEPMALQALAKFSSIDKSSMRNKTAYLAGVLRSELKQISRR